MRQSITFKFSKEKLDLDSMDFDLSWFRLNEIEYICRSRARRNGIFIPAAAERLAVV